MALQIRKAKKQDVGAIVGLNQQLADFHRGLDDYYKAGHKVKRNFKKHLLTTLRKRKAKVLVAEDGNKIVGFFIGKIEPAKPYAIVKEVGHIATAFIEEKYRKRGIGKKMFQELIKWFMEKKIRYADLTVDSRNEIGLRAWQKFGFKEFQKKMRLDL